MANERGREKKDRVRDMGRQYTIATTTIEGMGRFFIVI